MAWLFRRRQAPQIDQVGPATAYPHHGGAYPSSSSAADRPAWDDPTLIPATSPLMTLGQIRRACGDVRDLR